jgi:hypothetical protein
MLYSNGDAYVGEWMNEKAYGYGTYWHFDDVKYEGEWVDDL